MARESLFRPRQRPIRFASGADLKKPSTGIDFPSFHSPKR